MTLRLILLKFDIFIQAVLVTIVLLARYGNDGLRLQFGVDNTDFLGVGTSLGLALIVPLILLAYILGGSLFVMVSFWSWVIIFKVQRFEKSLSIKLHYNTIKTVYSLMFSNFLSNDMIVWRILGNKRICLNKSGNPFNWWYSHDDADLPYTNIKLWKGHSHSSQKPLCLSFRKLSNKNSILYICERALLYGPLLYWILL